MIRKIVENIKGKLTGFQQWMFAGGDYIYLAAIFTGLFSGAFAALLKGCINVLTHFLFNTFDIQSGNFGFIVLPIAGILIATAYTRYIAKQPMDHASDRIAEKIATNQTDIKPQFIISPIITCSVTLGMGGSAGGEDPICYTGAAIGSNVGKLLLVSKDTLMQLVGCGAAAGIAGIFMAPIGGVMFAIEVLKMKQSLSTIYAIIISSLTAALTCYLLLGCHTDVTFVPAMRFDVSLIPYVLACGVFCGIYSIYYRWIQHKCRKRFDKISNIWVKALIGGLSLAVLLFLFPSLYGEGYSTIAKLMADDAMTIANYGPFYSAHIDKYILMLLFGCLLLVKPYATSATNDSGGVGGGFTPTFFAGGVAGFLFAWLLNTIFGLDLHYALFTFFGMSAVMAGAVRAPLMAMFIAAEMTGLYGFILPLTISASCSYACGLAFDKYCRKRHQAIPR